MAVMRTPSICKVVGFEGVTIMAELLTTSDFTMEVFTSVEINYELFWMNFAAI
jgi:hypothetical protein